jgi:hypothetical protein
MLDSQFANGRVRQRVGTYIPPPIADLLDFSLISLLEYPLPLVVTAMAFHCQYLLYLPRERNFKIVDYGLLPKLLKFNLC